jgi:hypothetical protein
MATSAERMRARRERERRGSWFDIAIVYTNCGRAILAMEKGAPGDHAFTEAFAAWSRG